MTVGQTGAAVTVFAGSAPGVEERWSDTAYRLGAAIAGRGAALVYGAGGVGLMGAVSQGALDHGGTVVGVIPQSMMDREWGRGDLSELVITESMHQRKKIMADRCDGFICLPGGSGTLEELVEIWSWLNLGYLRQPLVLLDDGGFWQPLLGLAKHFESAGFLTPEARARLLVAADPDHALRLALG